MRAAGRFNRSRVRLIICLKKQTNSRKFYWVSNKYLTHSCVLGTQSDVSKINYQLSRVADP
jgi:hypothetical protein